VVGLKLIPVIKEIFRVNGTCDQNGTSVQHFLSIEIDHWHKHVGHNPCILNASDWPLAISLMALPMANTWVSDRLKLNMILTLCGQNFFDKTFPEGGTARYIRLKCFHLLGKTTN
jgi:hypothetical protein